MPARRDQIDMTQEEIWAYVKARPRIIVVSNGPGGYPHPMPMNFAIDDENRFVVVTFRKSQKVRNLERDPRASLLVESGLLYTELRSVLIYVEAEIVDDLELVMQTLAAIDQKDNAGAQPNPDHIMDQIRAAAAKRVALRFKPHKFISWDHTKLGGQY